MDKKSRRANRRATRVAAAVVALFALGLAACDADSLQAGFDAAHSSFNPETSLGGWNIAGLKLHWSVDLGTGGQANTSTPVVATINNVRYVFVTTADGHLEKWRADTHTRQWTIPIGDISAAGPWDGPTPSPAVTTVTMPDKSVRTEVIAGSPDGHYYAYDAASSAASDTSPPAVYWHSNADERALFRVVNSPTVVPGGLMYIDFGEFANAPVCFGAKGCWTSVLWSVYGVSTIDGTDLSGWDLPAGMMPTDASGNVLASASQYAPSGVAYDAEHQVVLVGEPNVFYDFSSGGTRDMTSGVLALQADNGGPTLTFAWESRWDNNGFGVPATPALSVGHERTFVNSATGIRVFQSSAAGGERDTPDNPSVSLYSSPAVAGSVVTVGTDNGYTKAFNFEALGGPPLQLLWQSAQAKVGGVGVPQATPMIVGKIQTNGVLAGLTFNTTGKGDLGVWNANGSGSPAPALADVAAHAGGRGGVAVSHGCVYVETADGHLAEWGL